MKVTSVRFDRCQLGWLCRFTFREVTAQQFTDETFEEGDGGQWWWLAYLRARARAKQLSRAVRAQPGERAAKGWAD